MKILNFLKSTLKWRFQQVNNFYISYCFRPKYINHVELKSNIKNPESIAIILQGGVFEKDDFTLNTVKLYKKHYPNSVIVLSTWSNTPKDILSKFYDLDIVVILNKMPKPIHNNGNLQVISTCAAINKAKEIGCKYVCKTRTDQRMYATDIFSYVIKLQEIFPLSSNEIISERLIVLGNNTYTNRLYDINDMWMFGLVEDMYKYWNCDLSFKWDEEALKKLDTDLTESYICIDFLKRMGIKPKWTYEDFYTILANYFIVIDPSSIDFYFVKRLLENCNRRYANIQLHECTFRNWINLYDQYNNK